MFPHETRRRRLTSIWLIGIIGSLLLAPLPTKVVSVTAESESNFEPNPTNNDSRPPKPGRSAKGRRGSFGKLPLAFEANQGVVDQQVTFFARGAGYRVFLTTTEAVFALNEGSGNNDAHTKPGLTGALKQEAVRMRLSGSNSNIAVEGDDVLPGKTNYMRGNKREQWRTGISTYAKVRYHEVYPKIDTVYYGTQDQLEYDFELAPGADPSVIGIEFSGVRRINVDRNGDLLLRTPSGQILKQHKPLIYQELDGKRVEIPGAYELANTNKVGFKVGRYDRSLPLIIDPVVVFATYLGGNCPTCIFGGGEGGNGIATDGQGNTYVIGATAALDFPTVNPLQPALNGGPTSGPFAITDAFITKYNSDGSAIIYSTYLGGTDSDFGSGIAADAAGNAYITGSGSTNFPVTLGSAGSGGGFIAKINSDGSALTYSVIVPNCAGTALAIDTGGNAYVTGSADDGFPLINPIQPLPGGQGDAFVLKLNASGSAVVYSTFVGGTLQDSGKGIAVDNAGNAYVAGETFSHDFPAVNARQGTFGGGDTDGFVTKVNAAGSAFLYSTFLGGSNNDQAGGIATNSSGDAFVTGGTVSTDFPTANALQPTHTEGTGEAFVTRLSANGQSLVYSTYLGGNGGARGQAIAADGQGNAYVTGITTSADFQIVNAFQPNLGGPEGTANAFVTKLNSFGSLLIYSSYLGGSFAEGTAIAADNAGNVYVGGSTSSGFPTVNPRQPDYAGGSDAFVAKIFDNSVPCGRDVTDRVSALKSSFADFFLPSLQFQLVLVTNKSNSPIPGPITFVADDLNNIFLANATATTKCYSVGGDQYAVARPGSDNVLSPGESVVVSLLFFRQDISQRIQYRERVVSGTPSR